MMRASLTMVAAALLKSRKNFSQQLIGSTVCALLEVNANAEGKAPPSSLPT